MPPVSSAGNNWVYACAHKSYKHNPNLNSISLLCLLQNYGVFLFLSFLYIPLLRKKEGKKEEEEILRKLYIDIYEIYIFDFVIQD